MQRVSSTDPAMPTERLLRHALISPLPLCSIPVVHVEMGILPNHKGIDLLDASFLKGNYASWTSRYTCGIGICPLNNPLPDSVMTIPGSDVEVSIVSKGEVICGGKGIYPPDRRLEGGKARHFEGNHSWSNDRRTDSISLDERHA